MENKDKLKDLIEKRYLKQESKIEKQKEDVILSDLEVVEYVPHSEGKKHFIVKIKFRVVLESGIFVKHKSSAVIENVATLDQKVVALSHPGTQEGLRYYYNKGKKLGVKK